MDETFEKLPRLNVNMNLLELICEYMDAGYSEDEATKCAICFLGLSSD